MQQRSALHSKLKDGLPKFEKVSTALAFGQEAAIGHLKRGPGSLICGPIHLLKDFPNFIKRPLVGRPRVCIPFYRSPSTPWWGERQAWLLHFHGPSVPLDSTIRSQLPAWQRALHSFRWLWTHATLAMPLMRSECLLLRVSESQGSSSRPSLMILSVLNSIQNY